MFASVTFDNRLPAWPDVAKRGYWPGLLVGNGASRAIWDGFAYRSLFDAARRPSIARNPLTAADVGLFSRLNTQNFEEVLAALTTARIVGDAMGQPVGWVHDRYESIRQALVQAVKALHLPWGVFTEPSKKSIADCLAAYEWVYSTNYDLLYYWARQVEPRGRFRDFFFTDVAEDAVAFDLTNTHIWGRRTRVLHLHGGLHLYRTPWGATLKRRPIGPESLLEVFGSPMRQPAVPLFVAEGSHKSKLSAIYRSNYLAFAYAQLLRHTGPLVIFGHSLGDSDRHIVDAINASHAGPLAVSVLPSDDVIRVKKRLHDLFPSKALTCFDATTHPLGDPSLRVTLPIAA